MLKFIKTANIIVVITAALFAGGVPSLIYCFFNPDFPIFALVILFYTLALTLIMRIFLNGTKKTNRRFSCLSIPIFMFAIWATMYAVFKEFNAQAIIFHIVYGVGTADIPESHLLFSLFTLLGVIIVCITMSLAVRQNKFFSRVDALAVVPLIVLNPLVVETAQGLGVGNGGEQVLPSYYHSVTDPKHNGLTRPNLIHVFLESAERTLVNENYFGPAMRPVMRFESKGLSASNVLQVKSTEWTIAGVTAAHCGVPLIQPWLATRNTEQAQGRFLPNATCLGDVLKADGYHTEYMKGADLSFAATDLFAKSHGFLNVEGFQELGAAYSDDRVDWGLGDKAIFGHAEKTVRELSKKDQPYFVTITSIGGHAPSGYPSVACLDGRVKIESTEPMGIGLECANALLSKMLSSLDADGLLDNTVVIIQSDHLMMGSDFTNRLNKLQRRDLFMVFGPNIDSRKINRNASMMDVYPTILEVLGYDLPEESAGLGVSLYSERKNLVETLGEDELNDAILNDSDLRRMLWLSDKPIDNFVTAAH